MLKNGNQSGALGSEVWLGRYLSKVGYQQVAADSKLQVLTSVMEGHIRAFPFEMLDYFLGTAPTVDIDSILEKFLVRGRAGGCSQQNALLQRMLQSLNISSQFGMAKIAREDERPSPRAHMVLFAELDGDLWLCDVGFGIGGPLGPLMIRAGVEQEQGFHKFRISEAHAGLLVLERQVHGFWTPLYYFDLRRYDLADFEPANYFNSLSPKSLFTKNLIVSRPTSIGGVVIRNDTLTTRDCATSVQERIFSVRHLCEILESVFSLRVSTCDFHNLPSAFGLRN
ncbi:arylamine N-acetyltransferase [Mesorhizobium sp. NPDC059054]|uniref:arylamine N-acetyltransferase family protein n=1 Tax=Mesorhizobium sp. NPDC059054 TaxID=3346711 RepID=UPI0036C083E9